MTTCLTCGASTLACTTRRALSGRHCCESCTDHRHPTAVGAATTPAAENPGRGPESARCHPHIPPRHLDVTLTVTPPTRAPRKITAWGTQTRGERENPLPQCLRAIFGAGSVL